MAEFANLFSGLGLVVPGVAECPGEAVSLE